MKSTPSLLLVFCVSVQFLFGSGAVGNDWTRYSPREEIAPVFSITSEGDLSLASERPGINGHWEKTFSVEGGKSYEFSAWRLAENIDHERRSCLVRIEWYGSEGKLVVSPHKVNPDYLGQSSDMARPDFPRDWDRKDDGSVLVRDTYLAPDDAAVAHVQLHLRWTDKGRVTWKKVSFAETEPLPQRRVKLAAVHHDLACQRLRPPFGRSPPQAA